VRFITTKKALAAVAAGAIVVGAAGVAFAYWSSSGGGDGSASTGASSAIAVSQDAFDVSTYPQVMLTPGGPAQGLHLHVSNPGDGHEWVASLTVAIPATWKVAGTAADHSLDCTASDFTIVQPTWTAQDVAGHANIAVTSGSVALSNLGHNQDACQNATPPLKFTTN